MKSGVRIRPAQNGDLPTLQALKSSAARANAEDRAFLEANPQALVFDPSSFAGVHIAALEDGTAVGFVATESKIGGRREITDLFVNPVYWRKGIGRTLLNHVQSTSRDRELFAIANPSAVALYAACGFKETGTAKVETGSAPVLSCAPEHVEPAP